MARNTDSTGVSKRGDRQDFLKAFALLKEAQDRMLRSDPPPYGATWQLCFRINLFRKRFACSKTVESPLARSASRKTK